MDGLLVIERFVLESLNRGEKNLGELELDTKLSRSLLINLLSSLSMKNIVVFKDSKYQLSQHKKDLWLEEINQTEARREEMKELMISLVNIFYNQNEVKRSELKMKKVRLSKIDERILDKHFGEIEHYLNNLHRTQKNLDEPLTEQRVYVWGQSHYGDLIKETMQLA